MSKVRRWYTYNNSPGGQQNHLNYFVVQGFPNACQLPSGNNICAVKGVYSESIVGSPPVTYGTHPKTFTSDTRLSSYINAALASTTYTPSSPQKPYVYMGYS